MVSKTIKPFASISKVEPIAKRQKNAALNHVQDFLQRFGYLEENSYNPGELDDRTSEALKTYQRANGRRATGEFNPATRAQMTTHRCGLPERRSDIAFSALCSWDKSELSFAFDSGTNDVIGNSEFQAVRNAFQTWAEVTPLTFTEVALNQNPDVVIDWRPANDPDYSMVGGVLAHADYPTGCSWISDTLPKPVHFDDEEHAWSIGAVPNAFDVETVALHEIGHILGLAHSSVAGSVMFASVSPDFTKRSLTPDDIAGIQSLYPMPTLRPGVYTIQQKSNNQHLDAFGSAAKDFSVVTRTAQHNDTQKWILTPVGGVFTLQQKSNNRFMDAYESAAKDFSLVTRQAQHNDSQRWVLKHLDNNLCTYTIQQLSKGRFVDAHNSADNDFSAITRSSQNTDTQKWTLTPLGNNTYTVQQNSNGRFLTAHEAAGNDFSVITRTALNNDTQRWILTPLGGLYTIQQKNNNRFVDAYESAGNDFSVITRNTEHNDTQRWVLMYLDEDTYTIQQLSSGRFMDAYESGNDFSVVTRAAQNNDSQQWLVKSV